MNPHCTQKIDEKLGAATELEQIRRQEYHEKKMRQRLRESNAELRELEGKLRAAYVRKGIAGQIEEKKIRVVKEKIASEEQNKILEGARLKAEESEKIQMMELKRKQHQLSEALQNQIASSHERKRVRYEDFLRDKSFIDEVIMRINEEHIEDQRRKLAIRHEMQQDMENFKQTKEIWRLRQRQEIFDENERLQAFIRQKEAKVDEETAMRMAKEIKRTTLNEQMCKELWERSEAARQRQELLLALQIEEANEEADIKMWQQYEATLRNRIRVRIALDSQKQDIIAKKRAEEELDQVFREKQLVFLAERDKIEQMSQERRHKKIAEHKRDIRTLLEERKLQRVQDLLAVIKTRELEVREEHKLQQLIEEERIRMLKEHAAELVGFLPPGIFRDQDRELFSLAHKKD